MSIGIYFCGEVVADMIERKEGSNEFQFHLGGSHYNEVMGAVRELGRQKAKGEFDPTTIGLNVSFVGAVATDMFGERFFEKLQQSGTDLANVVRVPYNTTTAFVSIRPPGQENGFSFYWRHTSVQIKPEHLPESLGAKDEVKICCFGSISTVIEPGRQAWLEFAQRQKDGGAVIFYDLNARPTIAKDPELYRSIVADWAHAAHIMKASDADIEWTYPGKSMQEVAALWLNEGATLAVFTKGMHGSEAYTRKTTASAETLDIAVENTVGAGDNFNAGFAISLAKAGIVTPEAVANMTQVQLGRVLLAAHHPAAYHLINNNRINQPLAGGPP